MLRVDLETFVLVVITVVSICISILKRIRTCILYIILVLVLVNITVIVICYSVKSVFIYAQLVATVFIMKRLPTTEQ